LNPRIFSVLLFFFTTLNFYAQSHKSLPNLNQKFSIVIHIVQDSINQNTYPDIFAQNRINQMNQIWQKIGVQFEICEINRIINYNFLNWNPIKTWDNEPLSKHLKPKHINIFITNAVFSNENYYATLNGIQMNDSIYNYCAISKYENEEIWAKMLGKYFGLYETNNISFGQELVNKSNCKISGDLVCDTDADPNGTEIDCKYTSDLRDANNMLYQPQIDNFMSNYQSICRNRFTHGQYERMIEQIYKINQLKF